MRSIIICLSSALAAAALPAPAVAASSDYFLKLGDVKGESAAMRGKEKWIEVWSYSFAATRKGWDGTIKGGSRMEGATGPTGPTGAAAGDEGPTGATGPTGAADGSSGGGGGGAAGKVSMQDMNVTMSIVSPRDSASGLPTGKRQHGSLPRPGAHGSVTIDGSFPGCTVGAAYADAELQVADGRYHLTDVQITSCPTTAAPGGADHTSAAAPGSDRPLESLSLNYTKIEVRAWNPKEKKE